MPPDDVVSAAKRLGIDAGERPTRAPGSPLWVVPYPGGRHPRLGFREGAIRPQRETKASVFAPWPGGGYVVVDCPEAVWYQPAAMPRELLYLAHTHVPTTWTRQQIMLEPLEWTRLPDSSLSLVRTLPNQVTLTARIAPSADAVRMQFRVTNGSPDTLTGLRVQMCAMLGHLSGFTAQTNDNKRFEPPFAVCHDETRQRWIITAWERCGRAWGNAPCPCLHSDPVVEDCPPGQSRTVRGWLSFYEGTDITAELTRIKPRLFE
jgi:hypothetical protein